jgi:Holliday junction DNA helicase RuvA
MKLIGKEIIPDLKGDNAMIALVRGEVIEIGSDHVILMVGGVGLRVFTTSSVCAEARIGENLYLHTYLVVREDALILYGFDLIDSRDFFTLLLGVNGVGPRIALSILSTLSLDAIRRAVAQEQPEPFARVTGVGRKTAQKILLHLQDKIHSGDAIDVVSHLSDVDTDVINALAALGYSIVESQSAVQAIPRDTPLDLETRLRIALQYFSR